jgi:two-component system NtrC family sensor kinase
MRRACFIFLLFLTFGVANAQQKHVDSLYAALKNAPTDTARFNALINLSRHYYIAYPDSAIIFSQQAYEIAEKHNWIQNEGETYNTLANAYATIGDYVKGMQFYFKALRLYESIGYEPGVLQAYNNIGATDIQKEDYNSALPYLLIAEKRFNIYFASHVLANREKDLKDILLENLGECYLYKKNIDSADYYLKIGYKDINQVQNVDTKGIFERDFGEVEISRGNKELALKYLRESVAISKSIDDVETQSVSYLSTAKLYHKFNNRDSAEYYAQKALVTAQQGKYEQDVLNAGKVLYTYYDEDHNLPLAYKYYKLTTDAKDSLYSQDKVKQLLSMGFDEKQRQLDIANAQIQYRDSVRMYVLTGGLILLLLLAFVFWRNSRHRQKANKLLQSQKHDLEELLSKLQLTQNQLIQSEKMASLGELTAGIAHEIQNPLNFVNNFSEVSIELSFEMKDELKQGNPDIAMAIADDIEENLKKIIHHGKRADSIVKGMLQHSRAGSTTKELTDLNALTDEYLRLAYHGLRAKDKTFNAELVTNYAKNLPKANVLPQDVGRVLLNLYTNAFYAVHQKQISAGESYKPTVEVSTASENGFIKITVKDNGTGMPENIKEKIMQPFFTTKPTGQGTGLGLSLSYDIVVKAHGGEINVDTKENDYTVFTISIPV